MTKIFIDSNSKVNEIDQLKGIIKLLAYKGKFKIISPFYVNQLQQRGETCKLKSLHFAMYDQALKNCKLVPLLYKEGAKNGKISLRQRAKEQGSSVGEMYSVESIKLLLSSFNYESGYHEPYNIDDYILVLKKLIQLNQPACVFFEMDKSLNERYGHPCIADGRNEHSVTIIGYYIDKDDSTYFLARSWTNWYFFEGMELASSSFSLSEKRQPEKFKKLFSLEIQKTQWVSATYADEVCNSNQLEVIPSRVMTDNETSLKGKIFAPKPSCIELYKKLCLLSSDNIPQKLNTEHVEETVKVKLSLYEGDGSDLLTQQLYNEILRLDHTDKGMAIINAVFDLINQEHNKVMLEDNILAAIKNRSSMLSKALNIHRSSMLKFTFWGERTAVSFDTRSYQRLLKIAESSQNKNDGENTKLLN